MKDQFKLDQVLVRKLEQAFTRNGWTEEFVDQACNGDFLGDARSVLAGLAKVVPNNYRRFVVDYGMSWDEMLSAANFGWKNGSIIPAHFPINGIGKVELEAQEFWFNANISSEKAEQFIRDADPQNPWESAKTEHSFAYAAQYPEQQLKYPIIGLGSVALVGSRRFVLRLYRGGVDRFLFLFANDWDGGWGPFCRFLAVRRVRKVS